MPVCAVPPSINVGVVCIVPILILLPIVVKSTEAVATILVNV